MLKNLLAVKSVQDLAAESEKGELRRSLGPAALTAIGIGCVFAGLCYAEFAAMIPVSGSAYAYSYATLGEGVAWFIGWNLVLEYLFAASTVSVGWSRYLIKLLEEFNIN